jgi:8-oxo-dGTP pyrophosphatase MutT (NUDIX family)
MTERIRYQAAIIRDDYILLIKHREYGTRREYWIIPGGGRENGESEEACVQREMREETHLDVRVERLLLNEEIEPNAFYQRTKTFLCRIISGEPVPGYEPEAIEAGHSAIVEVCWFDLRSPETWDALLLADRITFPLMQRIQAAMRYIIAETI